MQNIMKPILSHKKRMRERKREKDIKTEVNLNSK